MLWYIPSMLSCILVCKMSSIAIDILSCSSNDLAYIDGLNPHFIISCTSLNKWLTIRLVSSVIVEPSAPQGQVGH